MSRKRVPSYLHHKPSGQARVRIDGRDIYLGVYGSDESHKAYAREVAKWQARQECPLEDITVSQLSVLYLQHAKSYYVKGRKPTDHLVKVRNALKYLTRMYRASRKLRPEEADEAASELRRARALAHVRQ